MVSGREAGHGDWVVVRQSIPPADAPRLAQALASAFQDGAVIAWIFPDQQRRRRVPPAFKGTTIAPPHLSWCSGLHTLARGGVKRLLGRGCIVSGAAGLKEQTESFTMAFGPVRICRL